MSREQGRREQVSSMGQNQKQGSDGQDAPSMSQKQGLDAREAPSASVAQQGSDGQGASLVSVAHTIGSPPDSALEAVVVIPARDEEERVAACLQALVAQRGMATRAYEAILILDDCRDATRKRALEVDLKGRMTLHLVELRSSDGVGRARRLGMDLACARLLEAGRPEGLIASTDADSVVAEDWLAAQLALLRAGAKAIGGRIELDAEEAEGLHPEVLATRRRQAERRMRTVLEQSAPADRPLAEHHQFSGASLGVTPALYRACGGLPAPTALEDEALERTLRRLSVPIHRSRSVRVRTSARIDGRAPRGLAHDLALASGLAEESFDVAPAGAYEQP